MERDILGPSLDQPSYAAVQEDNNPSSSKGIVLDIKLYRRRYAILAVFCAGVFCNAFSFVQYSVVTDVLSRYYNVSSFAINFTGIVFTVGFVIGMVPAIIMYETIGLKVGIVVGLAGNAIGSCIKCAGLGPDMFWIAMAGQTLMAISQTCFLTLTPVVASIWFSCDEVSTAGACGILSNCLGISICGAISPLILYGNDATVIQRNFGHLLYSQAAVAIFVFLVALYVVRDQPEIPPSTAQVLARKISKSSQATILSNIIAVAKNKNICLLVTAFSVNYAVLCTLSTLFNQMVINVYGPGASEDVGYIILALQLANVFGAISAGVLLDKTKQYKKIAYTMFFLSFVCVAVFTGVIYVNIYAVYVVSALIGFFVGGFLTVGLDLCAEMSYPVSEVSALGLAGIIGNAITLLFMFSCGLVIDAFGELPTNLILVAGYVVSFVLLCFSKIELKRLAASTSSTLTLCEPANS